MTNTRWRAVAAFAVASLGFGTGFVAIKFGLASLPPLLFAAIRYDVGSLALLAYVAVRPGRTRPQTRADYAAVLVAAVAWAGGPATALAFPAYYALIDTAGPVRANLISYTVPLVATVTGALVLGELVPPRALVGFAVVVVAFLVVERENLRREWRAFRRSPATRVPDATEEDDHPCECAPRG